MGLSDVDACDRFRAAVLGLDFHQEPRRLRFGRIPGEIAEGLAVARATPAILGVVLVTIVMNTSGRDASGSRRFAAS